MAAAPLTFGLPGVQQGVQSGPLIVEAGKPTEGARDVFAEEVMSEDADGAIQAPNSFAHAPLGRGPFDGHARSD